MIEFRVTLEEDEKRPGSGQEEEYVGYGGKEVRCDITHMWNLIFF